MLQKPKGTLDLFGEEGEIYKNLIDYMCSYMSLYNYDYVKTPTFESTDLFIRGVGEGTDVVNKETYDFVDKGNRSMTLRPEFTASIVRMLLENKLYAKEVNKFYYYGSSFRYERPQNGRLREFTQFGVETFGVKNPYLDAEVISSAYNMLSNLGISSIKVKINSLGNNESRCKYKESLKDYLKDKLDNLCEDCRKRYETNPLRILDCKVDSDNDILKNVPKLSEYLDEESKEYLKGVEKALDILNVPYEIDENLVRGLDYYTDTVFEIVYDNSSLNAASTICGGGRYDNLVESLGGPNTPAFGYAIGVERLMIVLKELGKVKLNKKVDIYVMNLGSNEYSFEIVDLLRNNGFIVETDYFGKTLKSQFKIVDNINPSYVIIIGEDEAKGNYLTVKDNVTKESTKVECDNIIDYLSMNI